MKKKLAGAASLLALATILSVTASGPTETAAQTGKATAQADQVFPDAKPGECYAKVSIPAEYKTVTEDVVIRPAFEKIEIVPARYETVTEKVMVKEATTRLKAVAAEYKTVTEKVEVAPASRSWLTSAGKPASATRISAGLALGVPRSAKPGECYAEYEIPAEYKTEEVKVLAREAAEKIEVTLPRFKTEKQQVVTRDGGTQLTAVEPRFETKSEQYLSRPGYSTWKRGVDPITSLENPTGEILCLVEVEPVYDTVATKVLKAAPTVQKKDLAPQHTTLTVQKLATPAQEKRTEIPAKYTTVTKRTKVADARVVWRLKGTPGPGQATGRELCLNETAARTKTVQKQVVATPASVQKIEVPAEYKTVTRRKLVSPATEKRIPVAAQTRQVSKKMKVADGRLEWRPVLCRTNMTGDIISGVQSALKKAGYDPGPIDGKIGEQTLFAVRRFQKDKGIGEGGLTLATLESLGVRVN